MNEDPHTENFDVIIIGGGVAGLSAALWCDDLGLSAVILEKENEFGGQLLRVYNPIENHLGASAANGRALRDALLAQIENRRFVRRFQTEVVRVDVKNKKVFTSGGETLRATAIIIATGVRRRKLGIENEDFFTGRGIIESGKKEQAAVAGKTVLIVGGGDAAIENSLILAETAAKVYVVHRRREFTAREEFLKPAMNNEKIIFLPETIIEKLNGGEKLEAVRIKNLQTNQSSHLETDHLLLRIGVQPNTELFLEYVKMDKNCYIKNEASCETNIENVFAVGDVSCAYSPTVSTAVGTGATAVKVIRLRISN